MHDGMVSASCKRPAKRCRRSTSRHLNPLAEGFGRQAASGFKNVLIPELNTGQLRMLIRSRYLVDARGLNKVQGQPFLVEEIEQGAQLMLDGQWGDRESLVPVDHGVRPEQSRTSNNGWPPRPSLKGCAARAT